MQMAKTVGAVTHTHTHTHTRISLMNKENYTKKSVGFLASKKIDINIVNIDSFIKCA